MNQKQYFAAVCGVKNSGKTTLLERIVRELARRGLRTAVVKHDGHEFTCDVPGTDSFRYVEAGACGAAVFSERQLFVRKTGHFPAMSESSAGPSAPGERSISSPAAPVEIPVSGALSFLEELCRAFPEADVILAEGCKELPVRKIEVVRSGISSCACSNPAGRFLIVSDLPREQFGERALPFEEIEKIADAICETEMPADERDGTKTGKSEEKGSRPAMMDREHTSGREQDFTHFDESGRARMVNVGEKDVTQRTAVAEGRVLVSPETFRLIRSGGMKKGDVLGTAQIAGIMGAKRTPDLIPMCHPLFLSGIRLDLTLNEEDCCVDIRAEVSCEGKTGVEMEALTAVSTAALTVYDMCKAVQRDMEITGIRLLRKTGGVHGEYIR